MEVALWYIYMCHNRCLVVKLFSLLLHLTVEALVHVECVGVPTFALRLYFPPSVPPPTSLCSSSYLHTSPQMLHSWYKDFSDQQRNGLLSKLLVRQTDGQTYWQTRKFAITVHTVKCSLCVWVGSRESGVLFGYVVVLIYQSYVCHIGNLLFPTPVVSFHLVP